MTTDNFLPPDISGELEIGTSQTTPMLFIQAPNGSMMVTISYDGTRPWWGKMTDWVANEIEGSKKFMQDIVQENIDLRARIAALETELFTLKYVRPEMTNMMIAKIMWDAYCVQGGGKTFDGKPLPTWEELGEERQGCWLAAAEAARAAIEGKDD